MNSLSFPARYQLALLIVGVFLFGIFCGAFIDRYRTPEGDDPKINLYSPLNKLPEPNEKILVQYRFGTMIALYLSQGEDDSGAWYEVNELSPDTSKYCLNEIFGLPLRWGRIPDLPLGLDNPRKSKKDGAQ